MAHKQFRVATAIAAGAVAASLSVAVAPDATAALPVPSGYYAGNVTSFPPGNAVWYGKSFTGSTVLNNTAIGWAFPGKVYPGRSVLNGVPVIVVDYRGTPVGFVRDELKPDGRGGYWGQSINGRSVLLTFHLARR